MDADALGVASGDVLSLLEHPASAAPATSAVASNIAPRVRITIPPVLNATFVQLTVTKSLRDIAY